MDETLVSKVKFDSAGLVPCIVQDYENNEVLMMAYMNADTLKKSIATGLATYWSRSRNEEWVKGATSSHYQHIKSIALDCDYDTILIKVIQDGAACHTGARSCFFNQLLGDK